MATLQGASGRTGARNRFEDIPTRWSHLKGPPRDALDYLFRTYGSAIHSYINSRLGRGDFSPLGTSDSDDLLQDFFVRLGTSGWLGKPDPSRGRFRPYLVRGLVYFLRERRAVALGRPVIQLGESAADTLAAVATPDPLDDRFEREWEKASVKECLRKIAGRNPDWRLALESELRRGKETDAEVAARLGWTVESLRGILRRARPAFRDLYRIEEQRLDGIGNAIPGEAGVDCP